MNSTDYINRNFLIFNVKELSLVDFTQVLETSTNTIRKSIDETKTFVKWDGDEIPSFLPQLTTGEGPYSYEEMLVLLQTEEWASTLQNVI